MYLKIDHRPVEHSYTMWHSLMQCVERGPAGILEEYLGSSCSRVDEASFGCQPFTSNAAVCPSSDRSPDTAGQSTSDGLKRSCSDMKNQGKRDFSEMSGDPLGTGSNWMGQRLASNKRKFTTVPMGGSNNYFTSNKSAYISQHQHVLNSHENSHRSHSSNPSAEESLNKGEGRVPINSTSETLHSYPNKSNQQLRQIVMTNPGESYNNHTFQDANLQHLPEMFTGGEQILPRNKHEMGNRIQVAPQKLELHDLAYIHPDGTMYNSKMAPRSEMHDRSVLSNDNNTAFNGKMLPRKDPTDPSSSIQNDTYPYVSKLMPNFTRQHSSGDKAYQCLPPVESIKPPSYPISGVVAPPGYFNIPSSSGFVYTSYQPSLYRN